MSHINIEIKARCNNPDKIRTILKSKAAKFKGIDHQIDTYFKVNSGRLKLREGNIENFLIFFQKCTINLCVLLQIQNMLYIMPSNMKLNMNNQS
jgi:hypothetical protein